MLRVITTGGTIDMFHDTASSELCFKPEWPSLVPALVDSFTCGKVAYDALAPKRGLEMNRHDIEHIGEACLQATENCLVVTLGLSALSDTQHTLGDMLDGATKRVVLTGSRVPASCLTPDYDARNVLRRACQLAVNRDAPYGVYCIRPIPKR